MYRMQVILFAAFLIGFASASHTYHEDEEENARDKLLMEEWHRIKDMVYAKDGQSNHPNETLAMLKLMLDVEGQFSQQLKFERQQHREKTEQLVNGSLVSNSKCNYLFYHLQANYLIKQNLNNTLNVLPYLNHYKKKQFHECKDTLARWLKDRVNSLDGATRQLVDDLRRSIMDTMVGDGESESGSRYTRIPMANMKEGLLTYMRHLQMLDNQVDSESLKKKVLKATNVVKMRFDTILDIYNQYICEKDLVSQVDQETLDWITTGNICRSLAHLVHSLSNEKTNNVETFESNGQKKSECWWFKE